MTSVVGGALLLVPERDHRASTLAAAAGVAAIKLHITSSMAQIGYLQGSANRELGKGLGAGCEPEPTAIRS